MFAIVLLDSSIIYFSCSHQVDKYFTVQPHTLIRQHLDYSHWYDRNKLSLKDVHNTQYVACMNPTAGSFTINPRLQRHFSVFALSFPGKDALATIYTSILSQVCSKIYLHFTSITVMFIQFFTPYSNSPH